jgi:TatA/E family protein of Tat protein translocase
MFGNIGMPELLIILFIVLLLFGARKLPELAKGLGKGISEFKRAAKDVENEINKPEVKPPEVNQITKPVDDKVKTEKD